MAEYGSKCVHMVHTLLTNMLQCVEKSHISKRQYTIQSASTLHHTYPMFVMTHCLTYTSTNTYNLHIYISHIITLRRERYIQG